MYAIAENAANLNPHAVTIALSVSSDSWNHADQ
jgi:hypothetical protein